MRGSVREESLGARAPAAETRAAGTSPGVTVSARGVALDILRRVEVDRAYADRLLEHLPRRAHLDRRDRALVTELVYGTLRWQRLLDWHLASVSRRPLADLTGWARVLLRLSAYQLFRLDRIPPWAVVHEAVELAKPRRPRGAADFVNGVLRALADLPQPWPTPSAADPIEALALRVSQPTWLVRRWVTRLGEEEAEALARAMNARAPLVVRINTLRTTAGPLAAAFLQQGARVTPCRYAPDGLMLADAGDPSDLGPLHTGWAAVQDEGAILVGHVVAPEPGETVADVCAAPGTKTTHLAQLMRNRGRLLATDVHPGRVQLLQAACARMGVTIVETHGEGVDALARRVGAVCDRVLVDAPCSNLGVLRRNPDGKWRRGEADLATLAERQSHLVDTAATLVRPGGILVYATCSLEPEENEAVVAAFRVRRPDFVPDPIPGWLPAECRAGPTVLRMLPHRHGTDGFTAQRLRRTA